MSTWEEREKIQAEAKRAQYQAELARELKDISVCRFLLAQCQPIWLWGTLWLTQILCWGFLMMTFKKNVWPK